jgi:hypothetical protein
LKKDYFSYGDYEYNNDTEIGQENGNGKYRNNYSTLKILDIINTPIDTYEMVRQSNVLTEYRLKDVEWEITSTDTQYCKRNKEYYEKNPSLQYYQYKNS